MVQGLILALELCFLHVVLMAQGLILVSVPRVFHTCVDLFHSSSLEEVYFHSLHLHPLAQVLLMVQLGLILALELCFLHTCVALMAQGLILVSVPRVFHTCVDLFLEEVYFHSLHLHPLLLESNRYLFL